MSPSQVGDWREIVLSVVFGWPTILGSLALSSAGILNRRPWWVVAGAALGAPFAWYLSGSPLIGSLAYPLPLLQLGAALSLRGGRRWLAWLLLVPFAGRATWLAWVVLTQPR